MLLETTASNGNEVMSTLLTLYDEKKYKLEIEYSNKFDMVVGYMALGMSFRMV